MRRFFLSPCSIKGNSIQLDKEESNHAVKVLRLGLNDKIEVFDGKSCSYSAVIEKIENGLVSARIIKPLNVKKDESIKIVLFQSIPKSLKMDFVIQKGTELGVSEFRPLLTKRTIPDGRNVQQRHTRWQRIAKESSKQCGRKTVPEIFQPVSLSDAIKTISVPQESLILVLDNITTRSIKSVLQKNKPQSVYVFVGPEGGFTPDETKLIESIGGAPVNISGNTLRTETAGIVAVAMINYEYSI